MRTTIPREKKKYLLRLSDRSGFKYFKRELVKDKEFWVHPSEMDEPAPYPKYIGGEGESSIGNARSNRNGYPTQKTELWTP